MASVVVVVVVAPPLSTAGLPDFPGAMAVAGMDTLKFTNEDRHVINLIDIDTVYINGVAAGNYNEAYQNNPDYQQELWGALQDFVRGVIAQRDSFTDQLSQCNYSLEQCQLQLSQ
jgi:hypothetical protein